MEKRNVLGIGHLTKSQLQYEAKIRGLSIEGSVPELSQRLRGALDSELSVSPDVIGQVSDAVNTCSSLLSGVQSNLELLEGSCPSRTQVFRVQAQLAHLLNRVQDVGHIASTPEEKRQAQELRGKVIEAQDVANMLMWRNEGRGEEVETIHTARTPASGVFDGFNKLPNPLLPLIQDIRELSVDSTSEVVRVLWLTVKLQEQADVLRMPHQQIFQILYPLARGKLSRIISQATGEGVVMQEFRRLILESCVPSRCRNELLNKYFFRVQGSGELFSRYVEEIRVAMAALCVNVSESEVVNNILEGMTPEDRSRVVFCSKPRTFYELDQLVANMQVIKFSDELRGKVAAANNTATGNQGDRTPRSGFQSRVGQGCFRCGQKGHFVRDCPVYESKNS